MSRFVADQNKLVFFHESGLYGSSNPGLGSIWPGQVQSHDLDESTGVIPVRYLGGADRNVDSFEMGPKDYTGTYTYYPQDWRMVFFALGSCVDAGSPSPYSHVISEVNSTDENGFTSGTYNPFISFALEDSKIPASGTGKNFVRTVKGCTVNTWTLTGAQGEILNAEVNYIAQNTTFGSGATTAVTAITNRPYMWKDCTLYIPSGAGATNALNTMKDFSLTINNNLSPPHYLNGSEFIAPPTPLNRDYEFTTTLDMTSEKAKTFWESYLVSGTEFNMMLKVSASTGSREAFFIFSGCKLLDMDTPSPMEGVSEQSLTIQPKTGECRVNDLIFKYKPW